MFVIHMAKDRRLLQYLLLRNIAKSASIPEAFYFTYIGLSKFLSDKEVKEFNNKNMEPFLHNSALANQMRMKKEAYCNVCTSNYCQAEAAQHNIMPYAIGTLDLNLTSGGKFEEQFAKDKYNYKKMRRWQTLAKEKSDTFKIRLLSFNILAQCLLESYMYLYKNHDKEALAWEVRKPLIWEEIFNSKPNIVCLQEMQEEHLVEFLEPFLEKGYSYLYKQRTNDKLDGLLILYQAELLQLVEHTNVEYFRPNVELLSRDNVGLVAKFQFKEHPETQFVIATTHLLYNPRRNDVRLGQTQLLFSELEKMAFVKYDRLGPNYLPIILSGDFNLEPYTGVYEFITRGFFTYKGKGKHLREYKQDLHPLKNTLIPPYLNVTDDCQRYETLVDRLGLKNTDSTTLSTRSQRDENESRQVDLSKPRVIEMGEGYYARFSSGSLSHPFRLRSVYMHRKENGEAEATTHQDAWITVDYIFFNGVQLIEKYALPSVAQCHILPKIPNFAVGSDHLSLGATFAIEKQTYRKNCKE